MFYATYRDDRDSDDSAIIEAESLDTAIFGVFEYFARTPESWTHCTSWQIRQGADGPIVRQEPGPGSSRDPLTT
jgi:hypothetical protein